jgi:hypothetical protein
LRGTNIALAFDFAGSLHLQIRHPNLAAKSLPALAQSPMSGSFCQNGS